MVCDAAVQTGRVSKAIQRFKNKYKYFKIDPKMYKQPSGVRIKWGRCARVYVS